LGGRILRHALPPFLDCKNRSTRFLVSIEKSWPNRMAPKALIAVIFPYTDCDKNAARQQTAESAYAVPRWFLQNIAFEQKAGFAQSRSRP
jgi:hypothetical protein